MKKHFPKFLLAGFIVLTFVIYAVSRRSGDNAAVVPGSSSRTGVTANAASNKAVSGPYKDGQYTGTAADAVYGNIQVKATLSGGKLTGVEFLQSPNDRSTSVQINAQAMPVLQQEAMTAQSNQVDIVSGATDTSQAFIQSLGAALTQAKS